jgi:hypothetical protein
MRELIYLLIKVEILVSVWFGEWVRWKTIASIQASLILFGFDEPKGIEELS